MAGPAYDEFLVPSATVEVIQDWIVQVSDAGDNCTVRAKEELGFTVLPHLVAVWVKTRT